MRRAALALLGALAGCAPGPGLESDWERAHRGANWKEEAPALPSYPRTADLVGFSVPVMREFRFFVDAATLSVGKDDVLRYTLVARAPDGTENVTYEGLRCATGEYRIYAIGRPDQRTWAESTAGWRPLSPASGGLQRLALQREYFCRPPARDRQEALRRLREGGWHAPVGD